MHKHRHSNFEREGSRQLVQLSEVVVVKMKAIPERIKVVVAMWISHGPSPPFFSPKIVFKTQQKMKTLKQIFLPSIRGSTNATAHKNEDHTVLINWLVASSYSDMGTNALIENRNEKKKRE